MTVDAFVGLGSNLADPATQLARAVAELASLPATRLVAQSPFYASQPVGPQDQPDFVNGAVWLRTSLSPHALLDRLQAIEQAHGRLNRLAMVCPWGRPFLGIWTQVLTNSSVIHLDRPFIIQWETSSLSTLRLI